MTSTAVVFAYHNVGVRCLQVLLAHGVNVALVVTHRDNPNENIWFDSVAELAALHGIAVITPDNPNTPDVVAQIKQHRPDFLFSFYYRNMLKSCLLELPTQGALNMHGSLLPKYRGRVPVNWAIIKGETETGASLHYMTEKPDNGDLVDQTAVPILPDDTAQQVFEKVTVAAEITLNRSLPLLLDGRAKRQAQDLSKGAYFGGRSAADGVINWADNALNIHNLIRAVAPPYPGATTTLGGKPLSVLRSLIEATRTAQHDKPSLYWESGRCYADCADGKVLRILAGELDGKPLSFDSYVKIFGATVQKLV